MYAYEDRLFLLPLTFDEGEVLQSVALLAEGNQAEMAVVGGHVNLFADFDERLFLQAVGNHILDADDLHVPLLGMFQQLGQTGHRTVFVHDLHEGTGRVESGHAAEVDGGFGVSAAAQHAVLLSIERVDVSRTSEGLWGGSWIGKGADGLGTVVGGDASGAALELIDGHSKGGAEYGGVVLYLMGQVEFLAAFYRDRGAEYAAGVLQHEVHLLGCNLLSSDDQVALILAVLVVDDNHEFAFSEILYGFFYCVQLDIIHILSYTLFIIYIFQTVCCCSASFSACWMMFSLD